MLPPDMALVVTLRSGERIVARLGLDEPAARARLQEVQLGLTSERFVRVSDELVLRSDEVHAVELVHERELSYAAEPWQQGAREGDRVSGEGRTSRSGRKASDLDIRSTACDGQCSSELACSPARSSSRRWRASRAF